MYFSSTPNRTICDVLEEMRKCYKTRNFASLNGLIEEAQSMANRMEAALWDQKDYKEAKKKHKQLIKEMKEMQEQLDEK